MKIRDACPFFGSKNEPHEHARHKPEERETIAEEDGEKESLNFLQKVLV